MLSKLVQSGWKFITDSGFRFNIIAGCGFYDKLSDKEYLRRIYKAKFGIDTDFTNPKTFNEKLNWIKLYDHNPLYTLVSDKYAVREYVAEKIGEEHLVPLIGVYDSPEEIDFDSLPNRFVLKCNHNSGLGMYVCNDKSLMNVEKVKAELKKGIEQDFYLTAREWQYKDIKRKIVCEENIQNENNDELVNYKIMCFNGVPEIINISTGELDIENLRLSYIDKNWKFMPFCRQEFPRHEILPERPENLDELLKIAEALSKDFYFMRVDLYAVGDKIYFSELTMSPCGGFGVFVPEEWNRKIGDMFKLPNEVDN